MDAGPSRIPRRPVSSPPNLLPIPAPTERPLSSPPKLLPSCSATQKPNPRRRRNWLRAKDIADFIFDEYGDNISDSSIFRFRRKHPLPLPCRLDELRAWWLKVCQDKYEEGAANPMNRIRANEIPAVIEKTYGDLVSDSTVYRMRKRYPLKTPCTLNELRAWWEQVC